ncbi:MAG: hypothetical protein ACK5ZO_18110 [Gemmatimonas sp.]|uniref:hypothetical protein n=1 Tax=Gemmatimonas sp. TaxID=1962908 RepID=UPI00391D0F96
MRFPTDQDSRYLRTIEDARRGLPLMFALSDEAVEFVGTLEDGSDLQSAALVPIAAWNALRGAAEAIEQLRANPMLSAHGRNDQVRTLLVREFKKLNGFGDRANRARLVAETLALRLSQTDRPRSPVTEARASEVRAFVLNLDRGKRMQLVTEYVQRVAKSRDGFTGERETLQAILTAPLPLRDVFVPEASRDNTLSEIARALSPDLAAAHEWAKRVERLATDAGRGMREWLDSRWQAHGGTPVAADRIPDLTRDIAANLAQ